LEVINLGKSMKNIIKILILVLFFSAFGVSKAEANFSCYVAASPNSSSDVAIIELSSTSNAHAALPGASSYTNAVYCGGVSGISNQCSGNYKIFAKLSGATNAHVRAASETDYPGGNNACLSNSNSRANIEIAYQDNNCNGFDTTIASLAKFPTNSHIGEANAYPKKICASMSVPRNSSGGYLKDWGKSLTSGLVDTVSNTVVSAAQIVFEGIKEVSAKSVFVAKSVTGKIFTSKQTFSNEDLALENEAATNLITKPVLTEQTNQKEKTIIKPETLLASTNASGSNLVQNLPAFGLSLISIFVLIFIGRRLFV